MNRLFLAAVAALSITPAMATENYALSIQNVTVRGNFVHTLVRVENNTDREVRALHVQCVYLDKSGNALNIESDVIAGARAHDTTYGDILGPVMRGIDDVQCRCRGL